MSISPAVALLVVCKSRSAAYAVLDFPFFARRAELALTVTLRRTSEKLPYPSFCGHVTAVRSYQVALNAALPHDGGCPRFMLAEAEGDGGMFHVCLIYYCFTFPFIRSV